MNTLNCSIGRETAEILPVTSQIITRPQYIVHSLQDLLDALSAEGTKDLAMLRTTASHLAEFLSAKLSDIPVASIIDSRAEFRLYLESRKYKKNSIRSFCNYVGILLRHAQILGWERATPELPEEWRNIADAFPTGAQRDIIWFAVKLGKTPKLLSDDDLENFRQHFCDKGGTDPSAMQKVAKFLGTIRRMQLVDHFPRLLSATPKLRYGVPLSRFPVQLRNETELLVSWKQAEFAPGRPRNGQHSKATAENLRIAFVLLFGYVTNIAGREGIKTIKDLVSEEIVTSYVHWYINVRKLNRSPLRSRIKLLAAAVHQHPQYKNHDWSWFPPLIASIPDDRRSEAEDRKLKRTLPYSVARSIPDKLNARRASLDGLALARNVRDELLMKWLIVFAWRRRNIRECRIGGKNPNLFKGPIRQKSGVAKPDWVQEIEKRDPEAGFWQVRFSEQETKMKRRVHVVVPRQLVPLLEEYLLHFRPLLVRDADVEALFVTGTGAVFSKGNLSVLVSKITRLYGGVRTSPHMFRDIVAYEWLLNHPEDYLTLSKILWHSDVQTTIRIYGSQFNESNGVCRMDNWLAEREAKAG
jgi:integrase